MLDHKRRTESHGRVVARCLPTDLACLLVERHDILLVRAVAVDDQQIPNERRCSALAHGPVGIGAPDSSTATRPLSINAAVPLCAEVYVDTTRLPESAWAWRDCFFLCFFEGASWRKTSTLWMISPDSGSTAIARRDWPPSVAVVNQSCPPSTTGEDQPCPRNRFLPGDVLRFTPRDRQTRLFRNALARRTAKLGPIARDEMTAQAKSKLQGRNRASSQEPCRQSSGSYGRQLSPDGRYQTPPPSLPSVLEKSEHRSAVCAGAARNTTPPPTHATTQVAI